jgi:cyclase
MALKRHRVIARLDVKGPNLIKGLHLEGLRQIGDPHDFARKYYEQGADELIYLDVVASLYGRSKLTDIVSRAAEAIFVPLTVGGGVRSVSDVSELLQNGADKVAVNSALIKDRNLVNEIAREFGSQCMVVSIEARRAGDGSWNVFTNCGREKTNMNAVEWAAEAVDRGAGEVLVTSIDQEGTRRGFDCKLVDAICGKVSVPVIASGGYGEPKHLKELLETNVDGMAFADALHYDRTSIPEIKEICSESISS